MTHSADEPSATFKDLCLATELGQQTALLQRFLEACNKSFRPVLSLCEWTIRPGEDGAPVLEIDCPTHGSRREVLHRSLEIANQLHRVLGPTASILVRGPRQIPEMRNVRYPYRC